MELTEEEKWSLSLSENEHNHQVRMVYFEMKRCADCGARACWPHNEKMVSIP